MAKLTANGVTIEGTPEELAAIMKRFSTEADVVESMEDVVEPFKVGDYAKVIRANTVYNQVHEVGAIVKITKVDVTDVPYRAVGLDGNGSRWFSEKHIEKATEAEVAQAEVDAIEHKRTEVFTANGRKVNEYRKGDIVRYIGNASKKGTLVEVHSDTCGQLTKIAWSESYPSTEYAKSLELVTFVENRLDRK